MLAAILLITSFVIKCYFTVIADHKGIFSFKKGISKIIQCVMVFLIKSVVFSINRFKDVVEMGG